MKAKFCYQIIFLVVALLFIACGITFRTTDNFIKATRGTTSIHQNEMHTLNPITGMVSLEASIAPENPQPLAGFGGISRRVIPPNIANDSGNSRYQKNYTSINIAPRVKVTLFFGTNASGIADFLAIVNIDTVGISPDFKFLLLKQLQSKITEFQVTSAKVQIVATHTHSGPAGLSEDNMFNVLAGDKVNTKYRSFVLNTIVDLFAKGISSSSPIVNISLRTANTMGLNNSRMHNLEQDKRLKLITWQTAAQMACSLFFAAHSTFYGTSSMVLSADIAGALEADLEAQLPAQPCSFFPMSIGNASPAVHNNEALNTYANRVTQTILAATETTNIAATTLRFGTRKMQLPQAAFNAKACGASVLPYFVSLDFLQRRPSETSLSFLELGSLFIVFFPGETSMDFTLALQKEFISLGKDPSNLFIVSTSNDYIGYVLSKPYYNQTSLEACSSIYNDNVFKAALAVVTDIIK